MPNLWKNKASSNSKMLISATFNQNKELASPARLPFINFPVKGPILAFIFINLDSITISAKELNPIGSKSFWGYEND